MPDLSHSAVHAFWRDYDKRVLYRIITSMEAVEDWVLDNNPEVEAAMENLAEQLDKADHFELKREPELIRIIANLSSSRALRILQALDAAKPGTASKLLLFAEDYSKKSEGKEAKLFLNRNLVFERLQLLGRVFAPERMSLVLSALETTDE